VIPDWVWTLKVWKCRDDEIPHGFRRSADGYYNSIRIGKLCVAFGFDE
jgi:hypothetical protein